MADHYADRILLGVARYMGEGETALVAALDTKYYDGDGVGEHYGLYASLTQGKAPNTEYHRYWHGSAAVVRLLHLVTDASGIKTMGLVLLLLLIAALVAWLLVRRYFDVALALLLSLAAVGVLGVRLSLEYQPAPLVAFVAAPLYLWAERKSVAALVGLSVAVGASICFFDFLTTETLTIVLPLALVTAVRAKRPPDLGATRPWVLCVTCGGAWGLSYAATFAAKWGLVSAVTGKNACSGAILSAAERVGGKVHAIDGAEPKSLLSSLTANLSAMLGSTSRVDYATTWICLAFGVMLVLSFWFLFRKAGKNREAVLALALLALVAPARLLILNNHSFLHNFFTYRALASTLFSALMAVWLNVELGRRGKRGGRAWS